MDNNLTESLRVWLETPPEERDLAKGALYMLQLSGNKILYGNMMRNLTKNADVIQYQIQKYYNYRVRDLTRKQVEEMDTKVARIIDSHFRYTEPAETARQTPASFASPTRTAVTTTSEKEERSAGKESTSSEFRKGKREDHDSLPVEVQALYVENNTIMQKMRELHLQLRMLSTDNATCPDSERYPFLKEIIELDRRYHSNWDVYDHFVPGESIVPARTQAAEDADKAAVKVINLMKGRYKKTPTEELRVKIIEAYGKLAEPSDKLTAELSFLGIIQETSSKTEVKDTGEEV